MIDTAWARSTTAIRTAAASLFGDARPAAILLTHIHPDHSGSAGALARSWDVPVYVHDSDLPIAAGEYLPQYANPLDRWILGPVMGTLAQNRSRAHGRRGVRDFVPRYTGSDPYRPAPRLYTRLQWLGFALTALGLSPPYVVTWRSRDAGQG